MNDPDALNVWFDDRLVGYLWRNPVGAIGFRYEPDWIKTGQTGPRQESTGNAAKYHNRSMLFCLLFIAVYRKIQVLSSAPKIKKIRYR